MSILKNSVYLSELEEAVGLLEPVRRKLADKSITVTGATGIIGREIVDILMHENAINGTGITVHAVGRDKNKVSMIFSDYVGSDNFVSNDYGDVRKNDFKSDYIIHLASVTASKTFIEKPIEVLSESFTLTKNMLEYACETGSENFLYISSMEAYGNPYEWQTSLKESDMGYLSTTEARNCYPIAKNMCEMLTTAYICERNIRAAILRPCKSFGLAYNTGDKRLFADFAEKARNKENIILHTRAEELYSYCYVMDVALTVLYALFNAENGQIYNISNNDNTASVKEIAEIFASEEKVGVEYDLLPNSESGYISLKHAVINSDKAAAFGYAPRVGLKDGIKRLLKFAKENSENR